MEKPALLPPKESKPLQNRPIIVQVDTIRVFAMFGVFLHHLWNGVVQNPRGTLQNVLDGIFDAGADGVILFNILSGFLLALPYLGLERRPFPGSALFLRRRLLRIIPPYYIGLALLSLGNIAVFSIPVGSAVKTLLIHALFLNSFSSEMLNTNFSAFWYLGMLAQFYLLFPLVLQFFLRVGARKAALTVFSLCWGGWALLEWYASRHPGSIPDPMLYMIRFNLPGRMPEFAVGMWLASTWKPGGSLLDELPFRRGFSLLLLACALYGLLGAAFLDRMGMPFSHMYHVALCILLFMILFLLPLTAKAGRVKPMQKLSAASYSIYIVHQPLFSYFGVLPGQITSTVWVFLKYLAVLLPVSYIFAEAINRLFALIVQRLDRISPAALRR